MNLTSGKLYWPTHNPHPLLYPSLDGDLACEVAVIGGGITGALVAHRLVQAGLEVVLLDKGRVGGGSTAASTALLLYELDIPLVELKKVVGPDRAVRSYRRCARAIDEMAQLTSELPASSDFSFQKSLYLASTAEDARDLQIESEARRTIGLEVEYLDEGEVASGFSIRRPGAILSHKAAQVDPYRLTHGLIRDAVDKGLRSFEQTEVAQWEASEEGVSLMTSDRQRVRARRVVIATGYEADRWFHQPLTRTQTTYVLTSEPVESFAGWTDRCLIWETARPYLYLRTTADGRIMIGGEDDSATAPPTRHKLHEKATTLLAKFSVLFRDIEFCPATAYSGIFESTRDGLPYVGRHPRFPNVHFALGYGGNGITFSVIAAEILRDLFIRGASEDAELFSFER